MARGPHKYTVQEAQNISLGQAGVAYLTDTNTYEPPTGQVVVEITFILDTVFASATAAEEVSTPTQAAAGPGTNSDAFGSDTFPAGVTIYGRWTAVDLTSGATVLYLGS